MLKFFQQFKNNINYGMYDYDDGRELVYTFKVYLNSCGYMLTRKGRSSDKYKYIILCIQSV